MTPHPHPPRLARALLGRMLPTDVRDDIRGDLEEMFERDRAATGLFRARMRYWRKAASFSARFGVERGWGALARTRMSWMDFKLGFRMLARYPGLTIVGGLAIAFAVAVGATIFQLVALTGNAPLPLDEGDRIVRLRLWYLASRQVETQAAFDYVTWQRDLTSIEDLGVYRNQERTLIADGRAGPVTIAEMSASGFTLARVAPLLGRALTEADERPDAPPVLVIGYRVWQSLFAGDPAVIGRPVHLGADASTIVGVMPEGFAFPVSEEAWIPMRLNLASYGRRAGPGLNVFGRLGPGVSMARAQAELTTLGRRASADFPDTHEHIRPQVMAYARAALGVPDESLLILLSVNVFVGLLLMLVCGNVALLMFARAATRESEIVVRSALGAGRGRIVMQLFTEALVLGGVAAVVGLGLVGAVLRAGLSTIQIEVFEGKPLPFWFTDKLSPWTFVYAAALTVFAAVIAGVVPALKITRALDVRLRQTSAGGGGLRFGGIWTAVIVMQVALTVALPAIAFYVRRDAEQIRAVDVGFPAERYLAVKLEATPRLMPGTGLAEPRAAWLKRFHGSLEALQHQLLSDPGVAAVTAAETLPRMYHTRRWAEVDEGGEVPHQVGWPAHSVSAPAIDVNFFDTFGVPMLAGRDFQPGDRDVAIVNQSFVTRVLDGRNPIGRRVRLLAINEAGETGSGVTRGPWHDVVGVVRDLGLAVEPDPNVSGFYRPLSSVETYPVHLAVHTRGAPDAFSPRMRALAAAADPSLRVDRIERLDQVTSGELRTIGFWFRVVVGVTTVTLVLSLAGIYAVMSFTVSRRTREIGIRVALGARPQRVVLAILKRPLLQVSAGLLAGVVLVVFLMGGIHGAASVTQAVLVAGYAMLMMAVCLLACIVPARRALRVQPTEALRADG